MQAYRVGILLLILACCLAGPPGWAQRTAVAPLIPSSSIVQPASPKGQLEGVQLGRQSTRQPLVSAATESAMRRVWPEPIYLLNSHIIMNGLAAINPQDIAHLEVYKDKGANVPAQWRSLTKNGVIDITLKPGVKPKLKTKSLNAIRRQANVSGSVSFKLNGMRLDDSSLRVAAVAIAGLDVLRDDSEMVINIRLAPGQSLPRHDPPGTIYIRGVASH